jgi:hypothetical protein
MRALVATSGDDLAGRIVEIKFLQYSERTLIGPNTPPAGPRPPPPKPYACLNLWWQVPSGVPAGIQVGTVVFIASIPPSKIKNRFPDILRTTHLVIIDYIRCGIQDFRCRTSRSCMVCRRVGPVALVRSVAV